jgi:hypothetical protein
MKVEIENYRGWDISFDTDKETFYAVSSEFDTDRSKQSYASIKKSIDDYIKANVEFKPFKVLLSRYGTRAIYNVVGIRKDKQFIIKKGEKTEQLSKHDEEFLHVCTDADENKLKEIEILREEQSNYVSEIAKKIDAIANTFVKLNINDIRQKYSQ